MDDLRSRRGAIVCGHMDCAARDANSETSQQQQDIVFLYKLVPGACPKSYGFNAARLANLPEAIVRSGVAVAEALESRSKNRKRLAGLIRAQRIV